MTGREVRREAPGWPVAEFRHGAHVTSRSLKPVPGDTDKIIAELEQGRLPWVQPWSSGAVRAPLAMPKTPRPVATGGVDYFPLAPRAIPSEQNSRLWPSSAPRWLAAEMNQETSLAIIGTFTQNGNGLQGTVKTLTPNAKVRFVPVEKDNDKSWVIAGTTNVDLGAARKKTSKEGRPYTSVKLDIRASGPRSTPH